MDKSIALRIAFLCSHPAPYFDACFRYIHQRYGVEILIVYFKPNAQAPFAIKMSDFSDYTYCREDYSLKQLSSFVEEFKPDAIYVPGWIDLGYLWLAFNFKAKGIRVICGLDGQWYGSIRQMCGIQFLRLVLDRCVDILWVAGERQSQYGMKLGYGHDRQWHGLYCCDLESFSHDQERAISSEMEAFLFVGRYVPEKGISVLLDAFRAYRSKVAKPWKLLCVGSGPLKHLFNGIEGVEDLGFIAPALLPSVMRRASVFLLPSLYEPWGVVLQEAMASGLVPICSAACGAGVHLVQDGYSGYVVETGSVEHLTECMLDVSSLGIASRIAMANAGRELAGQFSPKRWASTLVHGLRSAYDKVRPTTNS